MSDLLGIAGTAVTSYQLALGTVSNNIANVSTEGYSRQEVGLSSAPPRQLGGAYIGTGVVYERVKRQYDAFADLNLRNSISELSSQEPMVDYANRVVDLMGSDNAGLVSALDQFFSAARGLTTDPASTVLRGDFFRSAQGLTSRFGLISSQLDLVDIESREALESSVGAVNTLAQQLAAINVQLSKQGSVTKQSAELLDQRDRLLREMSEHARVRTTFAANGAVNVSLGSTADRDLIVDGVNSVRVGAYADPQNPDRIGLVLDPYGQQPRSLPGVTSGKLAGLMSFREQVLDSSRSALDTVARTLMNEVNELHRSGVDAYGQMGGDLFRVEAGARRVAGGLKLAVSDPMRIAAAAQFRVIESANNVGRADATVSFANPVQGNPKALAEVLLNNAHPSAAKTFQVSSLTRLASVASIPAGLQNVSVYLNEAQGDQQLQLVTRDGRHLLGAPLSGEAAARLLGTAGMQPGATYSSEYLGLSGTAGYQGMEVFYGARAEVRQQQAFDDNGTPIGAGTLPSLVKGDRLASNLSRIPDNAITLNGVALPALQAAGARLTASEVAAWLGKAGRDFGISASAVNEVRIPGSQLTPERGLVLNGTAITLASNGIGGVQGLVAAINDQKDKTQVQASISADGALLLTNTASHAGDEISVGSLSGSEGNALNVSPLTYTGRVNLQRLLESGQAAPIDLRVGQAGDASVLSDLGLAGSSLTQVSLPAMLEGGRIGSGLTSIPAGAIQLNGQAMSALAPTSPATTLDAPALAAWFNASSVAVAQGITARAINEVRAPANQLRLDRSLVLNGELINAPAGGFGSAQGLVEAINAQSAASHVQAVLSPEGELVLSNTWEHQGEDILIEPLLSAGGNALNITPGNYTGRLELQRALVAGKDTPIELSFGTGGKPSVLAGLGFRTAATIKGTVPDDVLVIVSDSQGSNAKVSSSYQGSAVSVSEDLRARPMEISFITPVTTGKLRFQIVDTASRTVLAERDMDPVDLQQGINYRGLTISFNAPPVVGDRFALDGNRDGKGNNDNIRALAGLDRAGIFPGGKTLSGAYVDQVNEMGNVAQQASIARDALAVVRDQAEEKRDKVSGVNLDEEAANLIRFQQAYQASAKVMQVASQLFDSIIQLR